MSVSIFGNSAFLTIFTDKTRNMRFPPLKQKNINPWKIIRTFPWTTASGGETPLMVNFGQKTAVFGAWNQVTKKKYHQNDYNFPWNHQRFHKNWLSISWNHLRYHDNMTFFKFTLWYRTLKSDSSNFWRWKFWG